MSLVKKVLVTLVIILGVITGLTIGAGLGLFDNYVKTTLEIYLRHKGIVSTISDLKINKNVIYIKRIDLALVDNAHGIVDKLHIAFDISGKVYSPLVTAKINIEKIALTDQAGKQVIDTKLSADYNINLFSTAVDSQINLDSIETQILLGEDGSAMSTGKATCSYQSGIISDQNIDCKLQFGEKATLTFIGDISKSFGKLNSIKTVAKLQNIPVKIYKLAETIFPTNDVIIFLNDHLKDGHINYGELILNLDKKFFSTSKLLAENLTGNFNVAALELLYDRDFPPLKNTELEVKLSGALIQFFIKKAYTSNTLITNTSVELNWTGLDTTNAIVTGVAKGPAVDFTDFIPANALEKAKISGIDLRKFTGIANSKISIIMPISPKIKNSYNITSELSNVGLKIFDNNVELQNAKVNGEFSGDKLIIKGTGKINHIDSEINYQYNFLKEAEYEQLLNIKSTLKARNQKLGVLEILSGNSVLNFEYKETNDGKSSISAKANLKDLEFYISKISIHKPAGDKADFNMQGNLTGVNQGFINFKLLGDNNLNITGNGKLSNAEKKITFPKISHYGTDVTGEVITGKDSFSATIQGNSLDLSKADMMKFLEKQKDDDSDTKLKVEVAKVKLKNNIWLDKVKLKIYCNKTRCYKGYLDSNVGSKFLKMLLKTFQDKEEWVITSSNAGAVFKGLGIYNNMKAGSMILVLNTKRQEVKSGEIVPILDGNFTFKKFVITDTPFLTRLVSFISLPGFMNFLTNNKNVVFSDMTGIFSYDGNILKISDASADGPYFDFTMKGIIDTNKRKIQLKGQVIPSLYGISTLLKNIPLIGRALSGGHRKGIVFAPYSIEQKY